MTFPDCQGCASVRCIDDLKNRDRGEMRRPGFILKFAPHVCVLAVFLLLASCGTKTNPQDADKANDVETDTTHNLDRKGGDLDSAVLQEILEELAEPDFICSEVPIPQLCNDGATSVSYVEYLQWLLEVMHARSAAIVACCNEGITPAWLESALSDAANELEETMRAPPDRFDAYHAICDHMEDCAAALLQCSCAYLPLRTLHKNVCVEDFPSGTLKCQEAPIPAMTPDSCRFMVRGSVSDDAECTGDFDCGEKSVCHKPPQKEYGTGVCMALSVVGEPCVGITSCGQGLLCVAGVCAPPAALGDACAGTLPHCQGANCWAGSCGKGLQCWQGTCHPLISFGAPCEGDAPPYCEPGGYCNEGTCSPKLPAGAECSDGADEQSLPKQCLGYCSWNTATCSQHKSGGQQCDWGYECGGAGCSKSNECYFISGMTYPVCYDKIPF